MFINMTFFKYIVNHLNYIKIKNTFYIPFIFIYYKFITKNLNLFLPTSICGNYFYKPIQINNNENKEIIQTDKWFINTFNKKDNSIIYNVINYKNNNLYTKFNDPDSALEFKDKLELLKEDEIQQLNCGILERMKIEFIKDKFFKNAMYTLASYKK